MNIKCKEEKNVYEAEGKLFRSQLLLNYRFELK